VRSLSRDCGPILVVDDDVGIRRFLRSLFGRAGYEVIAAETGEEALALAATNRPALVILDVSLPATSGYAVCSELRQRLGASLPILFLSGARTEPFDRVAGLLIGADDYLTKPFDPDELVARSERMIERTRPRRPSPRQSDRYGLTTRELEILSLLLDGLTQSEIAERLYLSPKTVGTHVQRTLGKMGVRNRTQAVAIAAREGLFEQTWPTSTQG
jgi:DNA-binding NarL/FixJ family response regulator